MPDRTKEQNMKTARIDKTGRPIIPKGLVAEVVTTDKKHSVLVDMSCAIGTPGTLRFGKMKGNTFMPDAGWAPVTIGSDARVLTVTGSTGNPVAPYIDNVPGNGTGLEQNGHSDEGGKGGSKPKGKKAKSTKLATTKDSSDPYPSNPYDRVMWKEIEAGGSKEDIAKRIVAHWTKHATGIKLTDSYRQNPNNALKWIDGAIADIVKAGLGPATA